jgi:hypothetical protein
MMLLCLHPSTIRRVRHQSTAKADIEGALPTLRAPVELILSDGDASVPPGLPAAIADALLGHTRIERWYSRTTTRVAPSQSEAFGGDYCRWPSS